MAVRVVYGPPGTGKTSHLLANMADLRKSGVQPSQIGFLAFTRVAANEALKRLNIPRSNTIRTLHSLAYQVANVSREQVVNRENLQDFAALVGYPISGKTAIDEGEQTIGDEMLEVCSLAKAMMLPLEGLFQIKHPDLDLSVTQMFSKAYDKWKDTYGYVDFNDMLLKMAELDPDLGIKYLRVDEGQDLSWLQWLVVKKLMCHADDVLIAGDDDQAIYTWAGANTHGMAELKAESLVLGQSHRVPRCAHAIAGAVIGRVAQRVPKEYAPRAAVGVVQRVPDLRYLGRVGGQDTLILYRNHSIRTDVEEWLIANNLPYTMVGSVMSGAFDDRFANGIRTFKLMQKGEEVSFAQLNCLTRVARHEFKRDIAAKDFKAMLRLDWERVIPVPYEKAEYYRNVDLFTRPKIRVSTIHSAKGAEADHVILMTGMGARTYEQMSDDEHRVWYVGVTRTKDALTIVGGDNPYDIPEGR